MGYILPRQVILKVWRDMHTLQYIKVHNCNVHYNTKHYSILLNVQCNVVEYILPLTAKTRLFYVKLFLIMISRPFDCTLVIYSCIHMVIHLFHYIILKYLL